MSPLGHSRRILRVPTASAYPPKFIVEAEGQTGCWPRPDDQLLRFQKRSDYAERRMADDGHYRAFIAPCGIIRTSA